jgi:hypothetical protein
MGVFTEWQAKYAAVGIATVPIDPETKLFRGPWNKIGFPASTELTKKARYQGCNGIGFACGPRNGITDVDIDAPDRCLLQEALERHGESPIIVETASGKFHIWYRYNGERRSVRKLAREVWGRDVPIDILGGGLSVAPPTTSSRGQYRFIRGGLEDVARLAAMRGLPSEKTILPDDVLEEVPPEDVPLQPVIKEGQRDNTLWRACMGQAKKVESFDELLSFSRRYNEENMQPALADSACLEKAYSAWKYEQLGLNTFGQRAVVIPGRLINASPDAQWLFIKLQRDFFWSAGPFPVPKDYASKYGMGWRRQYSAMREIIESRSIRRVNQGGRFEGDAATYAWVLKGEPGGWKNE